MSVSSIESSPLQRNNSGSDGEQDTRSPLSLDNDQRPERMRDWLIRMINSKKFQGLTWLDEDKTVFKVPWIHAKKRGYCRERDAALFREWAIHSGKYRQDSDPTVWKINFRCAINGLKDIMEIKDMQTEDCRVYKVLPSRSRRRRRAARRSAADPYPTSYSTDAATPHIFNTIPSMSGLAPNPYTHPLITSSGTEVLYTPPYTPNLNIKMEYPLKMEYPSASNYSCIQSSSGDNMFSATGHYVANSVYSSVPSSCALTRGNNTHCQSNYFGDQTPMCPSTSTIHHVSQQLTATSQTSSCLPICRQDSPDSGIGHIENQNSPIMVQQNSPLMSQQNSPVSPAMSQQHSPAMSQQHSPQQHSPLSQQQHSPAVSQQGSPLCSETKYTTNYNMPKNLISSCSMNIPSPESVPPCSVSPCTSPATTVLCDDKDMIEIMYDLEANPPTPPISPKTPSAGELEIRILYGTIPVHTEYVDCSKGCRIISPGESGLPHCNGPQDPMAATHKIVLPGNHPELMAREVFSAMKRGVLLEVEKGNVYVTPLCRTMIYCSESASPPQQALSLERETRTKVFDYNGHFRPALESYALMHGQSPTPSFILGLGQSWGLGRNVAHNLISIVVTHAQAKHDIATIGLPHALTQDLLLDLPDTIDLEQASISDIEADAFLQQQLQQEV